MNQNEDPIYLTWVYVETDAHKLDENRDTLGAVGQNRRDKWVLLGDFDTICYPNEKIRGRRKPHRQMDDFNHLINDLRLEDMGSKRHLDTWWNNITGDHRISERLDRALISSKWAEIYPNGQCINELALGSYHSPLIVQMKNPKKRKRFKFKEMWFEDPACKEVIRQASKTNMASAESHGVSSKLSRCRKRLVQWSKEKFDNNAKGLTEMKENLRKCVRSRMNQAEVEEARRIKANI